MIIKYKSNKIINKLIKCQFNKQLSCFSKLSMKYWPNGKCFKVCMTMTLKRAY